MLTKIPVKYNSTMSGKVGLGGGVPNVGNISGEGGGSSGKEFTAEEGVSLNGQHLSESKVTWIWKADDVMNDGLQELCEFWVAIPTVRKGVKAEFKVTCRIRKRGFPKPLLPDDPKEPAHELKLHFEAAAEVK